MRLFFDAALQRNYEVLVFHVHVFHENDLLFDDFWCVTQSTA